MAFKLKAGDGTNILVPDGDYYFNTKARGRRMMANTLSSDARRVYACLELATMGFQQELAVTMERGEQRPLTPTDVLQLTGLSRQNVRRGFEELEDAGLALRQAPDGGALRKGNVLLYSWAVPREPKKEDCSRARLQLPDWFPDSWEPLKPLISRYKYSLTDDEVVARAYKEEIDAAARAYKEAEMVAVRALEKICARIQSARTSSYRKNGKNIERTAAAVLPSVAPPPAPPAPTSAPIEALVAQELSLDDLAAQQLVAGCKDVEPSVTGAEIVELAREKIEQSKEQIRAGRITNPVGLLIKHVPTMCKGKPLQSVRARLEAQATDRANRIAYAREAWPELNEDERAEVLQKYPELAGMAQGAHT
jgi:hypothetical protein